MVSKSSFSSKTEKILSQQERILLKEVFMIGITSEMLCGSSKKIKKSVLEVLKKLKNLYVKILK